MAPAPRDLTVVGCMSGTSADGIDAAAVRIGGRGLEARHEPLAFASVPYGPLAEPVRALQRGSAMNAAAIASLSSDLAHLHVQAVRAIIAQVGQPDLVAMHGQTIHHAPPLSWQLASPAVVAAALDCDVISDLRAADLAEGGQGAPITPLADWLLMRDRGASPRARAIINLGGFCNATVLPAGGPPDSVAGFDVCLCNQLLDHACMTRTGNPLDDGGARAARGRADAAVSMRIADHLATQHGSGRSLGSAHERIGLAELASGLEPGDALATIADAIARAIARVVGGHPAAQWFAAGGGTRNAALMRALATHAAACGATLDTTDSIGVAPQAREAIAMAALGSAARDGARITLDRVTGRGAGRLLDGVLTRSHRIFTIGATSGGIGCG